MPLLFTAACVAVLAAIVAARPAAGEALRPAIPAAWLLAAAISSPIALAQWFGVAPSWPVISPADLGEAYGNLRQRNQFASLTSLGLVAAVWMAAHRGRARCWHYATVLLLASANAVSASRTGLLQWLLIAVLAAAWPGARRERLRLCAFALAAYALAAALLPLAFTALHGTAPPTAFIRLGADLGCSSRRVLWSNVLHLIAQRPWLGWGPGELDYAHYATLYPGERFCDILDNAHNLPLHLAVELGVPVALLACGTLAWLVLRARPWAEADVARQGAWAALAVIGAHSLLEYPLWYGPFQLAALLCVGVLAAPRVPGPAARGAVLGAAGLVLGAVAFLAAEYATVTQAYLPPQERRAAMRADPIATAGRPLVFDVQLRFAELSITPVTRANAAHLRALAREMLHYSPEPPVIEKLIESATLLGATDEALWHAARFRAAFPERYAEWAATVMPPARP